MFDIEKKIEEIRKEPEHIRLRWVYTLVGVSMSVIALIWILSIRINLSKEATESGKSVRDITETINKTLKDNPDTQSIEELIDDGKETLKETTEVRNTLEEISGDEAGVSLDSILYEGDDPQEEALEELIQQR